MIAASGLPPENKMIRKRKSHLVIVLSTIIVGVLLLASCLSRKIYDSRGGLAVNPYNLSQLDIEYAKLALASAEADSALLTSLLKLTANPYEFSGSDIEWSDAQLQQANQNRAELQQMLNTLNYDGLWQFIPNQDQIDSGKVYWSSQKQDMETLVLPYWDLQLRLAFSEDDPVWVEFCNGTIGALEVGIEMMDALLSGLHADDSLINQIKLEKVEDIVKRKIAVQSLVAQYYDEIILILYRGIELEVNDWSGVENVIADSGQIEQGKTFWAEVIDTTTNSLIPFWENEHEVSEGTDDTLWIEFTGHMLANLSSYVNLANQILQDLSLDSVVIEGASSEVGKEIWERKTELNRLWLNYYRDLVDVLREGINLSVVQPSGR